jgi:hypothetical protein
MIDEEINRVIDWYTEKRAKLRMMPKGGNCVGCPYWNDLEVKCFAEKCEAPYEEPDWESINEKESEEIKGIRQYFGDP